MGKPVPKTITIRIGDSDKGVSVQSLIQTLENTIGVLQDLERRNSETGEATIEWDIIEASYNSPLMLKLAPKIAPKPFSRRVIADYMDDLNRLEIGEEQPRRMSVASLNRMSKISEISKEQGGVTFETEGRETVRATPELKVFIETVLKRGKRKSETTLLGRLEQLSVRGPADSSKRFGLFNLGTDRRTDCYFEPLMLKKVMKLMGERVRVHGLVTFDRDRRPVSMKVESLVPMRSKRPLPDIRGGETIDITGGMPAEEYIRRMRDEDW